MRAALILPATTLPMYCCPACGLGRSATWDDYIRAVPYSGCIQIRYTVLSHVTVSCASPEQHFTVLLQGTCMPAPLRIRGLRPPRELCAPLASGDRGREGDQAGGHGLLARGRHRGAAVHRQRRERGAGAAAERRVTRAQRLCTRTYPVAGPQRPEPHLGPSEGVIERRSAQEPPVLRVWELVWCGGLQQAMGWV